MIASHNEDLSFTIRWQLPFPSEIRFSPLSDFEYDLQIEVRIGESGFNAQIKTQCFACDLVAFAEGLDKLSDHNSAFLLDRSEEFRLLVSPRQGSKNDGFHCDVWYRLFLLDDYSSDAQLTAPFGLAVDISGTKRVIHESIRMCEMDCRHWMEIQNDKRSRDI